MTRLLTLAFAACLAACAPGKFTAADIATAQAMAAAVPATAGDVPCYAQWGALVSAARAPKAEIGIFSVVAFDRAVKATATSGACVPITLEVMSTLGKAAIGAAPGGGFLGALLP
jgi:hypothetical protein